MAYLGQGPFQEFSNPPTKDSFTGDGSTVAFDLNQEVPSGSQNALEVYVDNVRQEPGTGKAFTLGVDGSGDTKRITFSAAPANNASIYVINDKTNSTIVAPLQNDLNGTELILDTDGDTSITADTDDRIDFKIANVEHFSFSNSSGDTIVKPMVDAKDSKFMIAYCLYQEAPEYTLDATNVPEPTFLTAIPENKVASSFCSSSIAEFASNFMKVILFAVS